MKASLNYWMPGNFLTGILNKVSLNRNTRETSTYINWLIKNIGTRDSQTLYLVFFLGVMVQYLLIQHLRCLFGTWSPWVMWINHSCCSVAKLCLTLYDPMDCSMPGFSVFHYLPEFAQTHDHWVCCHLSISSPAILFSFSMVHKHVCDVYIHIYIHTHMHRYTHTHTHTSIYKSIKQKLVSINVMLAAGGFGCHIYGCLLFYIYQNAFRFENWPPASLDLNFLK